MLENLVMPEKQLTGIRHYPVQPVIVGCALGIVPHTNVYFL